MKKLTQNRESIKRVSIISMPIDLVAGVIEP